MADARGENEGFRILDDFVCDAIPGPGIALEGPFGRGENEGMHFLWELDFNASQPPLAEERKAEFHKLGSSDLHALVRNTWSELTPAELEFLHELALERMAQKDAESPSHGAERLSREVMNAALRRI